MDHITENTSTNLTRELIRIYEKFGYLFEEDDEEINKEDKQV